MLFKKSKPKVFCIGLNKTGTTSLGAFLEKSGFIVDKQRNGEALLPNYLERDFKSIITHCKNSDAQVFQDVPFSLPYTYGHLDNAFPNSKFILTIRNSNEQWYNSILKFHSDTFNKGNKPTYESLVNSTYVYKGWTWDLMNDVFINDNQNTYDKQSFMEVYDNHIASIKSYFKNKSGKLIIINLSKEVDLEKLCNFLEIQSKHKVFPRITSADILDRNYDCEFLKRKK
jgi:hypothetical protein